MQLRDRISLVECTSRFHKLKKYDKTLLITKEMRASLFSKGMHLNLERIFVSFQIKNVDSIIRVVIDIEALDHLPNQHQ